MNKDAQRKFKIVDNTRTSRRIIARCQRSDADNRRANVVKNVSPGSALIAPSDVYDRYGHTLVLPRCYRPHTHTLAVTQTTQLSHALPSLK